MQLLLSLGASVVDADIHPPAESIDPSAAFTFHHTDVTSWADLTALFKRTKDLHRRIDHVFANAGISPRTNYLTLEVDDDGELKEPQSPTIEVNMKGAINTAILAIHHMRNQPDPVGGSIVITCSIASVQRFRSVDYTTAKHAVLGFMRAMKPLLEHEKIPIRINGVAPSWTQTGIIPEKLMSEMGIKLQTPFEVGRAAAGLMADQSRHGHLIHIAEGRYKEIDEAVLVPAYMGILGEGNVLEDTTLGHMMEAMGGVYKDKV